jgi:hypothetical protein
MLACKQWPTPSPTVARLWWNATSTCLLFNCVEPSKTCGKSEMDTKTVAYFRLQLSFETIFSTINVICHSCREARCTFLMSQCRHNLTLCEDMSKSPTLCQFAEFCYGEKVGVNKKGVRKTWHSHKKCGVSGIESSHPRSVKQKMRERERFKVWCNLARGVIAKGLKSTGAKRGLGV